MNEKNQVEALLFASARRMNLDEISQITGIKDYEKIKSALNELRSDYEERGTSVFLSESDGFYKLTVKDHYLPMVRKVIDQTELDKPLMETLAVIAWKYPILQSAVIKIRHNKAYEHLKLLDELGFITRNRFGRTNRITLTQKFFEYFDLPSKEQVKEVFKDAVAPEVKKQVEALEQEIEQGEQKLVEMEQTNAEIKAAQEKKDSEKQDVPEEKPEVEENKSEELAEDQEESSEEIKQDIEQLEEKQEEVLEQIKEDEKELEEVENVKENPSP